MKPSIIPCIRKKAQILWQVRNERNCFGFCVWLCDSRHYWMRMCCTELKIEAWQKIVCRRKSESQTDPDKQIQPDKECDCVLLWRCVRSKDWGKAQNVIGWKWPAGLTSVAALNKVKMGGLGIWSLKDCKTFQKTGLCQTLWSSKTCSRTFKIILPTSFLTEHD